MLDGRRRRLHAATGGARGRDRPAWPTPTQARTLLLEWSAPPEADPSDKEAWRYGLAALDPAGSRRWSTPTRLSETDLLAPAIFESMGARGPLLDRPDTMGRRPRIRRSKSRPSRPARSPSTIGTESRGRAATSWPRSAADGRSRVTGRPSPRGGPYGPSWRSLVAERRGVTVLYPASFEKHVTALVGPPVGQGRDRGATRRLRPDARGRD